MTSGPALARTAPDTSVQGEPHRSVTIMLRNWRNRIIASQRFRRMAARFPGIRYLSRKKAERLFGLMSGFLQAQVLRATVTLGILDALADGPRDTATLARNAGFSPDRMSSLLRAAQTIGLVREMSAGLWMLDDLGAVTQADAGITAMIRHHDMFYGDVSDIEGLLAGKAVPTRLRAYWAYVRGEDCNRLDDASVAPYSALMRESQAMLAACITDAYDLRRHDRLLDIGGGEGAFLAVAGKTAPALRLDLFDLPAVARLAEANLSSQGLLSRTTIHAGDFMIDPLPGHADCVSLVRVVCDHDDARVEVLFRRIHSAMKPGATLVIAEAMAGESHGQRLADLYFSFYFLAMGSGRCRSPDTIMAMLRQAGFRDCRIRATSNPMLATLVLATR